MELSDLDRAQLVHSSSQEERPLPPVPSSTRNTALGSERLGTVRAESSELANYQHYLGNNGSGLQFDPNEISAISIRNQSNSTFSIPNLSQSLGSPLGNAGSAEHLPPAIDSSFRPEGSALEHPRNGSTISSIGSFSSRTSSIHAATHPLIPNPDGDSSSGEPPLLPHSSPSQIRRRQQRRTERDQLAARVKVAVPRWQPDAEVTLCPICRTQFSKPLLKYELQAFAFLISLNRFFYSQTPLQVY